jgi:cytochrome c-type biogenesis protein CcmE
MRKVLVLLLIAVFVGIGLATAQAKAASQDTEKKVSPAKGVRWSGAILKMDKDGMTLTVRRRGGMEKIIHYDASTAWTTKTPGGKVDPSTLKEGDRVVCLGKTEGDKFVATEIIVQTPK